MSSAQQEPAGERHAGSEPEIRFYQPGDEAGILALMERAFERWPRPELDGSALNYLRWKLHNHPDAPRYHMVAEMNGRIVGFRLFLIQTVKLGDRVLVARQETDTAVDPDFQGRGLMTSMSYPTPEPLYRDFDLYFALGSSQPAFRVMRKHEQAQRFSARLDVLVCSSNAAPAPSTQDCHVSDTFDERADQLWREASRDFDFAVQRTSETLNRRYADDRSGSHTITIAEEDGRLLGYIVTGRSKDRVQIADFLFAPDQPDVGERLLSCAAGRVECWMPRRHPYRNLLERGGFTHKRRTVEVLFLRQRAPEADLEVLARDNVVIHVMAGDTDLV